MKDEIRFLWRALRARFRDHRAEMSALLRALSAGDVAIDVGANKGGFSYGLARKVEKTGCVYAFEPQTQLAQYLSMCGDRLNLPQLQVVAKAVSDRPGTMSLFCPPDSNSPGATLVPGEHIPAGWIQKQVEIITLDDFLKSETRPVKAIKIDVEGHELAVLRGAQRTIQRDRPVIVLECEERHLAGIAGVNVTDVIQWVEKMGYSGSFVWRGRLTPVVRFDAKIHQAKIGERYWDSANYCNNFVFLPEK
jgi:FkbM family methyltransferase